MTRPYDPAVNDEKPPPLTPREIVLWTLLLGTVFAAMLLVAYGGVYA